MGQTSCPAGIPDPQNREQKITDTGQIPPAPRRVVRAGPLPATFCFGRINDLGLSCPYLISTDAGMLSFYLDDDATNLTDFLAALAPALAPVPFDPIILVGPLALACFLAPRVLQAYLVYFLPRS